MQDAIIAIEAAIAQPEQRPAWHPTKAAIAALIRFEETCSDNEGYDVPKDTMRNLAGIGLIYRTYGDRYCITDFGQHILAANIAQPEQLEGDAKDAERYRWLRDDDQFQPDGQRELYVVQARLPFREDQSDEVLTMGVLDAAIDAAIASQKAKI